MRTLAILALCAAALTACQNAAPPTTGAVVPPTFTPPTMAQVSADLAIGLNVAAQYEAIAKTRKLTPADYLTIVDNAVKQFAATQPSPTAAQVQKWTDLATTAAQTYQLVKGV